MMKARFAAIQVALKKLAARRPPRARPINNLHNFLEKRGEVWPNAALEKLLKKHEKCLNFRAKLLKIETNTLLTF